MSNPRVLVVSLVLALVGCGGTDGLTAHGSFAVTTPTFNTGIELAEESRIDNGGRVTGTCEIREVDGVRSVAIDLYTDGAGATNQLRRASITGVLGTSTLGLTAQLGTTTYSRGDCAAAMDVIDLNGNAVLSTSGSCELTTAGGDTVTADVDFALFGCTVITN